MTWRRGPLVWAPDGSRAWAAHSAIQPSPLLLEAEGRIRVFCGVRDADGRSSVGWVDVDLDDPTIVLAEAQHPALTFDATSDHWDRDGVVPTCVVRVGDELRMYYAGYERVDDPLVRFRVFCGLAISRDGGDTFERAAGAHGQILFPMPGEELFGVIHTVLARGDGGWRAWYGAGGSFEQGATKTLPVYDIRYMESGDGIRFAQGGAVVLGQSDAEYRVGRPNVIDHGAGRLEMFFGASSESSPYRLAWASSSDDGASWQRDDTQLGELAVPGAWDTQMSAYPAVVETPRGRVMFFNGDDYGHAGFGVAFER